MVAANKHQTSVIEISRKDFETSIEAKVDYLIPYDLKAAVNAAKLGKPFVEASKGSKASQIIREIGTAIVATDSDGDEADADPKKAKAKAKAEKSGGGSLLGMFAKKEKAPAPAAE